MADEDGQAWVQQFVMYDTFQEAMHAHAETCERPLAWNPWEQVAAAIARHYDDAPRPGLEWSAIRIASNQIVVGAGWRTKVENPLAVRITEATEVARSGLAAGSDGPGYGTLAVPARGAGAVEGAADGARQAAAPEGGAGASSGPRERRPRGSGRER